MIHIFPGAIKISMIINDYLDQQRLLKLNTLIQHTDTSFLQTDEH